MNGVKVRLKDLRPVETDKKAVFAVCVIRALFEVTKVLKLKREV